MLRNKRRERDRDLKGTLRRVAGFIASYFCDDLLGRLNDPPSLQGRSNEELLAVTQSRDPWIGLWL